MPGHQGQIDDIETGRGVDYTGDEADVIGLTAEIVASYAASNTLAPDALLELITTVNQALKGLSAPSATTAAPTLVPAVPVKKSVTADYIVCLEDGLKFKSLRRHLRAAFGLTPDQYRAKWGLPDSYPMVAPNYSAARSSLAKELRFGHRRSPAAAPAASAAKKPAAKRLAKV